jgi:putative multiple sugar transport system substrate-binding protein
MKQGSLLKALTLCLGSLTLSAQAYTVGLAMPTQLEDRWYKDGFALEKKLQANGFNVELFYGGDNDTKLQNRQIKRMTDAKVDLMVVGAIDCTGLSDSLNKTHQQKIPVISYDRLILNTNAITYYATFDNFEVGVMQGQYIKKKLNLDSGNHKTMEIFYGSLDDNNAKFFYEGAMSILYPYIKMGILTVPSGQIKPEETETEGWSTDVALKRMEDLVESQGYGPNGKKLDAILCPSDVVSSGVIFTLKRHGYTPSNIPVITGQDATADAIANVKSGYQAMTIYKSPEALSDVVVDMVKSISQGKEVKVNDTFTYNNGAADMQSYLLEPRLVDKTNVSQF